MPPPGCASTRMAPRRRASSSSRPCRSSSLARISRYSGLHCFTNGVWPTASASASRSWMLDTARPPPACMLVCPPPRMFTPSPNAPWNPRTSASSKPLPYASSITHRDDAPGDAEHREAGTNAVAEEADQGLASDLTQHADAHASNRSASTGGRSAARRAGYVEVITPTNTSAAIAPAPACQSKSFPRSASASARG